MEKMKSPRNKTIDIDMPEGQEYLDRCFKGNGSSDPLPYDKMQDLLILGDSFSLFSRLPEASIDLLITDPPYNLSRDYHGNPFSRMDPEEYGKFTRRWLEGIRPLLRDTASLYICCDWATSLIVGPIIGDYFHLRNRITWQREKGRGSAANWKNSMEDIWFATVSDEYTFHGDAVKQRRKVIAPYREDGQPKDWEDTPEGKFRDTCASNFWDDISVPYWSMAENTPHPAQKPEKLLAKLILASSSPGDLIFDPFAGSGSALVTAKKLDRRFLGIEENPKYCIWAQRRLEMADEDPSIQGFSDGVFWERNTSRWQKKR